MQQPLWVVFIRGIQEMAIDPVLTEPMQVALWPLDVGVSDLWLADGSSIIGLAEDESGPKLVVLQTQPVYMTDNIKRHKLLTVTPGGEVPSYARYLGVLNRAGMAPRFVFEV